MVLLYLTASNWPWFILGVYKGDDPGSHDWNGPIRRSCGFFPNMWEWIHFQIHGTLIQLGCTWRMFTVSVSLGNIWGYTHSTYCCFAESMSQSKHIFWQLSFEYCWQCTTVCINGCAQCTRPQDRSSVTAKGHFFHILCSTKNFWIKLDSASVTNLTDDLITESVCLNCFIC